MCSCSHFAVLETPAHICPRAHDPALVLVPVPSPAPVPAPFLASAPTLDPVPVPASASPSVPSFNQFHAIIAMAPFLQVQRRKEIQMCKISLVYVFGEEDLLHLCL